MFRWIVRLCLLILTTLLALPAGLGRAQAEPAFSTMEVDLWPEYDRANSVLVIYHIALSPQVSLPADLTLRIPAQAGKPNAVAVRDPDGTLRDVSYESQVSGEWALINFTAAMPEIQFEYYDPGLVIEGQQRTFEYRWPGDYPVDFLTIEVQQPPDAREMEFSPAADSSENRQDGLVYYIKRVGATAGGQAFSQLISYLKESEALTAGEQPVQPSAPITESPTTLGSLEAALPWLLGILGVGLLVGGVLWYWQSGKNKEAGKPRHRRRATADQPKPAAAADGPVHCHQCGKRAAAGDRFCRACGTKLRIE